MSPASDGSSASDGPSASGEPFGSDGPAAFELDLNKIAFGINSHNPARDRLGIGRQHGQTESHPGHQRRRRPFAK
jgi:hypothetical protein